jgi:uncharacterized protein (TIGR02757 family)
MAVVSSDDVYADAPLFERLEALYARLNRREFISPDPMQFLLEYPDLRDREVVGMVAASLAFGNVRQILRSVSAVLDQIPSPARYLESVTRKRLERTFAGFRHRYVGDAELVDLLYGVKLVREKHGDLESAFIAGRNDGGETVMPALSSFVRELASHGRLTNNYLLPQPSRGSACKRLHLFLRWMVRHDAVDPGGWTRVRPDQLIVPLDTHMHRISRSLGLTARHAGDIRTALEITHAFRRMVPHDPVRYDFALTRLGIRDDTNMSEFIRECGRNLVL